MQKLLRRKEAANELGIHFHTLLAMAERGDIETVQIGKQIKYNVNKYLKIKGEVNNSQVRRKICYCRVSSNKQKGDLQNQINLLKDLYPDYELISDIGSGLNNNRYGFRKIIDYIIKGEVELLIVTYKDRLTRFSFDLLEWMIDEYSNGKIIILNKKEEQTPLEEISKDILAIMNVYVAKINGLRKYKSLIKNELNT